MVLRELYANYIENVVDKDHDAIVYKDTESICDYNSNKVLLEEFICLNINKYFNISFLEYTNLTIMEKMDMVEIAKKYIQKDNEEVKKLKKDLTFKDKYE